MRALLVTALAAAVTFGAPTSAMAVDVFSSWASAQEGSVCYNYTLAKGVEARNAYITVTQRPGERIHDEFSIVSGLANEDIVGSISIDGRPSRQLLIHDGAGFVASGETEESLIREMKRGITLKATWTRENGSKVTDTYSLSGFTASLKDARRDCR